MKKPSIRDRFRYWFDGVMARGTVSLIGLLLLVNVAFIVIIGLIVVVFNIFPTTDGVPTPLTFPEVVWNNLMDAINIGNIASDEGWGWRLLMLLVTLFGLVGLASLIGIVSGAFDGRISELRKGRSKVLEKDHTVILGWSSKIIPIVAEICIANQSRKRPAIVILADRDKVEMEDQLRAAIPHPGKTRIIVRRGDPINPIDLEISNPHGSRSIIILPPDDSVNPDALVIKTALAITNHPQRRDDRYHIVAEVRKPRFLAAAELVGKGEAQFVLSRDLISRIMVQTSRQSGLSIVYAALLDFRGDEIYFTDQPSLVGKKYFEAQRAFATSTVIGILRGDDVELNPAPETVFAAGEQLIVITQDETTAIQADAGTPNTAAINSTKPAPQQPENTLVLGYRAGLTAMLEELSHYVAPGSKVTVVAENDVPDLGPFPTLAVDVKRGDVTDGGVLEKLHLEHYQHIIVLAEKDRGELHETDARTLITLLNLRDIEDRLGLDLKIVSEMLDDRNRELAEVTKADDFIVSDKLVSLVLSQISENPELREVFRMLFSSEGCEIYLRPAELYVTPGTTMNFYTVLESARLRGETAIGYRIAADARDSSLSYGVALNPRKTDEITFAPGDRIITLANI
ncbi:MAG: hypothetical protein ABJA94_03295 [Rhodoglobus sp.]